VASALSWGGNANYINQEQTLTASLSSYHMMIFLALAAQANWPVAHYSDHAVAELKANAQE
jgi:organic hydroperoxide reductase OsmC/OhrA